VILIFYGISQNCFYIGKVMNQVYGSWDNDWLSVHGELTTMGRRDRSRAWEVVVMAQRERGGRWDFHKWRHLEVKLQRRPHNDA
jgi:hypothetical protein